MGFLSRLTDIDPDEVSLVRRGANRRRILLAKADDTAIAELDDMLAVPVDYEGALTDLLRKEGVDEPVIEGTVAGLRILKAVEDDLPEPVRAEIAKIGSQMYPIVNKPLNNLDEANNPSGGVNDDTEPDQDEPKPTSKGEQAPAAGDDDESGEDEDDGISKAEFDTESRKRLASQGLALPDGSYPIRNRDDLGNAIQAFGRAKNKGRVKAWIMRRAKALGATSMLPDSWGSGGSNVKKEGTVSEGTAVAVPVPVRKEDGSWDLSGVPEESRPFYETVLKARDAIAEERDDLRERVEKAEGLLEEERGVRVERDFVEKAAAFSHVAHKDDLGPVLKAAAEALTEEQLETLMKALGSAEERIAKSDLFKEIGRSGAEEVNEESAGDAWSQIEKAADALVEKADEPVTKEQAIAAVLKTARGRELYAQYQREV